MRAAVSISPASVAEGGALVAWAKALLLSEGQGEIARMVAERIGAPQRVLDVLKTGVDPHATTDADLAGFLKSRDILTSFAPMLRNRSITFAAMERMRRIPLRSRLTYGSSAAAFSTVGEGSAMRIGRLAVENLTVEAIKAVGMVVLSNEFVRGLTAAGDAFLAAELAAAIAKATDEKFLTIIDDGDPAPIASVGTSSAAAAEDMRNLFLAVDLTADSRPLLAVAPDVAIRAATLIEDGTFCFPNMTPTGGTMLGQQAVVSSELTAGTMLLIDGAGIVGDLLGLELATVQHATVQMDTAPDSPTTASTALVNLWQHGLIGISPSVWFGADKIRAGAVAKLTGIAWASTDSPA